MKENTQGNSFEDELNRYQVFLEERKELLATAKEAATQYAKAIMTLSAGALALSLTFMKDIVPCPAPKTLAYLKLSWGSFSASLTLIVISFLLSEFAFIKQVEVTKGALLPENSEKENNKWSSNPYRSPIVILNILSLITFLLGVIFLVLFSLLNLGAK